MMEADRSRLIGDNFPNWLFWDEYPEKKQIAFIPRKPTLIKRILSGAMFEASSPGFPDYSSMFNSEAPKFYFREVVMIQCPWWHFRRHRWKRTGKVWRPKCFGRECDFVMIKGRPF